MGAHGRVMHVDGWAVGSGVPGVDYCFVFMGDVLDWGFGREEGEERNVETG